MQAVILYPRGNLARKRRLLKTPLSDPEGKKDGEVTGLVLKKQTQEPAQDRALSRGCVLSARAWAALIPAGPPLGGNLL